MQCSHEYVMIDMITGEVKCVNCGEVVEPKSSRAINMAKMIKERL
jgi:ribosomal protein S27E